jgi:hypothetical protein
VRNLGALSIPLLAAIPVFTLAACTAEPAAGTGSSSADVVESPRSVLLVSDIDDTIKRTDVLNKAMAAVNALESHNSFGGMSSLYSRWHGETGANRQIIYLSAAPGPLIELSKRFLTNSDFPGNTDTISDSVISGRTLLESAGDFKTKKLLEMYDEQVAAKKVPDAVILIGDNGEQDMFAYGNYINYVASKGGRTDRIYSFIHHVYDVPQGSSIDAPHRPWVTAADLAVQLSQLGLITDASLADVLSETASEATDQANLLVPSFMSCTQFSAWPELRAAVGGEDYATVENAVASLCNP